MRKLLNATDSGMVSLRELYDEVAFSEIRIVDEEGNNVAGAGVKRLSIDQWIYQDNVDGYRLMSASEVHDLFSNGHMETFRIDHVPLLRNITDEIKVLHGYAKELGDNGLEGDQLCRLFVAPETPNCDEIVYVTTIGGDRLVGWLYSGGCVETEPSKAWINLPEWEWIKECLR